MTTLSIIKTVLTHKTAELNKTRKTDPHYLTLTHDCLSLEATLETLKEPGIYPSETQKIGFIVDLIEDSETKLNNPSSQQYHRMELDLYTAILAKINFEQKKTKITKSIKRQIAENLTKTQNDLTVAETLEMQLILTFLRSSINHTQLKYNIIRRIETNYSPEQVNPQNDVRLRVDLDALLILEGKTQTKCTKSAYNKYIKYLDNPSTSSLIVLDKTTNKTTTYTQPRSSSFIANDNQYLVSEVLDYYTDFCDEFNFENICSLVTLGLEDLIWKYY